MPPTGSTFTDWQQVDSERRLLIDEDFSWSEPPARRRRPITGEPAARVARAPSGSWDQGARDRESARDRGASSRDPWDQPTQSHSHFDEMMEEWNRTYGGEAEIDVSDNRDPAVASARRTVVITGHGDDRYIPASRRRPRSSDLRIHERAGFSPDRTAMWAVLLGLVLLIASVAH